MVVLQVKRSDADSFLVEASTEEEVDDLVARLVKIWNTRVRLMQLVFAVRDLGKHGIMKPDAEHGLDHIREESEGIVIDKGEHYCADPSGKRTGNGVGPQLMDTFDRVCTDAEMAVDPQQVKQRIAITQEILDEKLDNIRGAVTMAYPMGLPEFDIVRLSIEGTEGLAGTQAEQELLEDDTAGLWMSGKEFKRGSKLRDRVGRNEKTKLVVKLQKAGSGPPGREAAVTEDERKAMMAHYFKKQEEMKKLAEATDDDYLGSSWADPKQLQRSLRGTGGIRAPGIL